MKRRVVVTGIGAVSPIGCDVASTWKSLIACKSGVRRIDTFDTSDLTVKIAGMVTLGSDGGFNPDIYISPAEQRKIDRFIIYAIGASEQAMNDSGFCDLSDEQKERTSVIIGSGIGGVSRLYDTSVTLHDGGARRVNPFFIPSVLVNLASGHIAIRYGITGPNYSIVSACASGTHSIGDAFRAIRDGYIDFAIAGGAEHAVCKLGVSGFAAARALSTKFNDTPTRASRPWDKERDGFVVGEGAGILTLETLESAKKRGATIYGEIVGYGASCDAYHITAPSQDAKGEANAMKNAILDANIEKTEIAYINAHGTSTPQGDVAEINAIKQVFGNHAYKLNVSSTKSSMGHLLGAAGAVEAIISLLTIRDNVIPATLNLEEPDEDCDLNLTPNTPQEREVSCVMSNSFGFGGTNASIILKKIS
ncbi:MAG: beta-ketoacyl-ACP synthase II [Holosporales bacterium]|nr:beta-ketoacyl-ACP synthase II [Holosporales bacterium]